MCQWAFAISHSIASCMVKLRSNDYLTVSGNLAIIRSVRKNDSKLYWGNRIGLKTIKNDTSRTYKSFFFQC